MGRCPICEPLTRTEAEAWAAETWDPPPFEACADPEHAAALTPPRIPRMQMVDGERVVILPEGQPVLR